MRQDKASQPPEMSVTGAGTRGSMPCKQGGQNREARLTIMVATAHEMVTALMIGKFR